MKILLATLIGLLYAWSISALQPENKFTSLHIHTQPFGEYITFSPLLHQSDANCPSIPTPVHIPSGAGLVAVLERLTTTFDSQFNNTIYAASAALTYRNQVIWNWNGGRDNRTTIAPTIDSVYRIGSVSKVFAWILAIIAQEKGLVNLNDPVIKTVPDLHMIDNFHSVSSGLQNAFTWNQLASHLAGVPREAPCIFINCNYTTDEMLQRLKETILVLPPQTLPSYSNLGFSLLGRLIADCVFQHPYEQLVQDLILAPLEMTSTVFEAPANVVPPVPAQPLISMGWSAPSGQMYSSVADLSRLAIALNLASRTQFTFGNPWYPFETKTSGFIEDTQPSVSFLGVRSSVIRETMYQKYSNPDGTGLSTPWEFKTTANRKYMIRNKAGSINGYGTDIALIPELQLALVLSTNFPTDASNWASSNLESILDDFEHILYPLQSSPPGPDNMQMYVGTYDHGTTISINLLGMLHISQLGGGRTSIPLVRSASAPNDPSILQVYLPEQGLPCMLGELIALAYTNVIFKLDPTGTKVISFSMPGFSYAAHLNKLS